MTQIQPALSSEPQLPCAVYLKDYAPYPFPIAGIDLDFQLFADHTLVVARLAVEPAGIADAGAQGMVLNGEELEFVSVSVDGVPLAEGNDFTLTAKTLTIHAPPSRPFMLETQCKIYPHKNTALEGLYVSRGMWCTQCEAEGFRRITYFPDRPDVMTSFTVRIEADKAQAPVLLSNGNLTASGDVEGKDGRHFTLWTDPFPKPCYLFALVAGDLAFIEDTFTTMSGRDVTLRIYVREGDQPQCHHAMASLKHAMKWEENTYGLEYDLDLFNIVAVGDFNMGAMENKSLNVFNTALVLAHPDTATDADFQRVEGVIAHEYFHNWSGNRITCRDWFQLSLKEGLTVFRDQEFSADMNSRSVQRIDDVCDLRRMQFPEDASPLAHPVRPDNYIEINNFYTTTVYEKGAEVIRMMRTILGAEAYRKATDLYFSRHDGQAVRCEDFVRCMEEASGIDLSQFWLWYEQAGTPRLSVRGAYDAAAQRYRLTLTQDVPPTAGQPDKKPMYIPVKTGLIAADGTEVPLDEYGATTLVLPLTQKEQTFTFENITAEPVPSVLRGFSAPVQLDIEQSEEQLHFLMVHDSDGFNRWEAGQRFASGQIHKLADAIEANRDPEPLSGLPSIISPRLVEAYGALIAQAQDPASDTALLARALSLPDEITLGLARKVIDPDALYSARKAVMVAIATAHAPVLLEAYQAQHVAGGEKMDAEAMGARALKNVLLRYIAEGGEPNVARELAAEQYRSACLMTDRAGALLVLTHMPDSDERIEAFADFYRRFSGHELAIDKWFSFQTLAVRESTIDDLKALRAHPDFNIKNPNRTRALYATFGMGNPVKFHAQNGTGYSFLADAIIELNTINPQIASRLLTPLRAWRRYTPERQAAMRSALERIAATPALSPNVYEIVTKSLAD